MYRSGVFIDSNGVEYSPEELMNKRGDSHALPKNSRDNSYKWFSKRLNRY
ncbi:hypothetical protein J41TS4_40660 [Paenibacillus apis]|uniref:Uncharacterized protein n=1 Tax=Paenibacillus apis TaxID=1792174 RepID=A0A920CP99_9BACL|nr:hypothetical protein J41TS4_40660 [Paenibacillus apis]